MTEYAILEDDDGVDHVALRLQNTTIASAWANEFTQLFGVTQKPHDKHLIFDDEETWGLMVGWFANAIEVGKAAGRSEQVAR